MHRSATMENNHLFYNQYAYSQPSQNYSNGPSGPQQQYNTGIINSVEFWASFVTKYEEYMRCLKNLSTDMMAKSNNSSPCQNLSPNSETLCNQLCSKCNQSLCHKKSENSSFHLPFDDSFSTTSSESVSFKDRQKRFNRFVKKRFIDEFGPIEYLSYKMLKRHESTMMDKIKHEARERYLPNNVTEAEFKVYWKSALNTIRQTRYRYRSKHQGKYFN